MENFSSRFGKNGLVNKRATLGQQQLIENSQNFKKNRKLFVQKKSIFSCKIQRLVNKRVRLARVTMSDRPRVRVTDRARVTVGVRVTDRPRVNYAIDRGL